MCLCRDRPRLQNATAVLAAVELATQNWRFPLSYWLLRAHAAVPETIYIQKSVVDAVTNRESRQRGVG